LYVPNRNIQIPLKNFAFFAGSAFNFFICNTLLLRKGKWGA